MISINRTIKNLFYNHILEGEFIMKKENFSVFIEIAKRAEKMNLVMFDRMSLMMDLECATDEFNLRLENLLNADDFNFAHDIEGIQNNLNRRTKEFENCFVPRFAGQ